MQDDSPKYKLGWLFKALFLSYWNKQCASLAERSTLPISRGFFFGDNYFTNVLGLLPTKIRPESDDKNFV